MIWYNYNIWNHITNPVKLDLGCGKNKKVGWIGVDCLPFEGVDVVFNLADGPKELYS